MQRHGGPPTGLTLLLHLRERETRQQIQNITVKSLFFLAKWPQSPSKGPQETLFSQRLGGTAEGKPSSTQLASFLFTQPTFIFGLHKSLTHHFMAGFAGSSFKLMVVM